MALQNEPVKIPINLRNVIIPVVLGFLVSAWQIYSGFNWTAFNNIAWADILNTGIIPSLFLILVRDAAYVFRLRMLTENRLDWPGAIMVIMLWEFGSAITPGTVGGIALAVFLLRMEKIPYGRGTAIIMITTFLDNLAYISMFGVLYLIKGSSMFTVSADCLTPASGLTDSVRELSRYIWLGYLIMLSITLLLAIGLYMPRTAKRLLYSIAEIKILRRFKGAIEHQADELLITADEFRNYPWFWFLKIFGFTLLSWLSRYLLVVVLILSFSGGAADALDVFVRQYVIWMLLIIPTTPGASGVAEILFEAMNCEFLPGGIAGTAALVWRLLSYYFYLVAGPVVLPKWLGRVVGK